MQGISDASVDEGTTALELRQLRYLVTVAEPPQFRRAAERMDVAQPAISEQIRKLGGRPARVRMLTRSGHLRRPPVARIPVSACGLLGVAAELSFRASTTSACISRP
jgi:hypothetical protein